MAPITVSTCGILFHTYNSNKQAQNLKSRKLEYHFKRYSPSPSVLSSVWYSQIVSLLGLLLCNYLLSGVRKMFELAVAKATETETGAQQVQLRKQDRTHKHTHE